MATPHSIAHVVQSPDTDGQARKLVEALAQVSELRALRAHEELRDPLWSVQTMVEIIRDDAYRSAEESSLRAYNLARAAVDILDAVQDRLSELVDKVAQLNRAVPS